MDINFIFDNKKIINTNNLKRIDILDKYSQGLIYGDDQYDIISNLQFILLDLYENDYESYLAYIEVLLLDLYRMLLYQLKQNRLSKNDAVLLELLLDNSITKENVIDSDEFAELFTKMIESSIMFDGFDFLGRKLLMQSIQDYEKDIIKVAPSHIIDMLHYGGKTTTDNLLGYYIEQMDDCLDISLIIMNMAIHLRQISIYDKQNYLNNIQDMTKVFYKWRKFKFFSGEEISPKISTYLSEIENSNLEDLGNKLLVDNELFARIISDFCYFSIDNKQMIDNKMINEIEVNNYMNNKIPSCLSEKAFQKNKK